MSRFILMISLVASVSAVAFFNMPSQMMNTGSQMMFPAPEKQPCICVCEVK